MILPTLKNSVLFKNETLRERECILISINFFKFSKLVNTVLVQMTTSPPPVCGPSPSGEKYLQGTVKIMILIVYVLNAYGHETMFNEF